MSKFLLEQLEEKFEEMESIETLQEDEEIDEANVTGNMDGGAGPPKTPNAFSKSTDEDDLDTDHIEVLGYKKAKKSKMNTESKTMKKLEDRLERIIEATYRDYKKDDSMKAHQKVNKSIKEINRMMYEVEKIVNQNTKLKSEMGVSNEQYWQSTQKRFSKISERMLKVARSLKELSA